MTYYELFTKAENLLIKSKISYGEYDEMVQPLNEEVRKEGEWIDHSNEGYVECPFCGSCTTCEDREISELIFDVFDLIHAYDWYASGDTCEGTYLEAKAEFKKKWLKRDDSRVQMIIDNAIDEARQELYKTYGVPQTERSE